LTLAVHHRAPLWPSRGLLRWLPPPARGLLRQLLGSPAPSLQRAPPQGWYFPQLRLLSTEDIRISLPWRLQLLLEDDCVRVVYSPSTMLASGSVASTAGATVSAWGAGVDSSADGAEPSSATVNQVRLPNCMYYSGKIITYRLDRTAVTVGALSMLAMSKRPASAGASSSASVAAGSLAVAVAAGSVLPSATGACDMASGMAGAGLRLLSAGSPTVSQSPSSSYSTGSEGRISCKQRNFFVSIHNIKKQVLDYSTRGSLPLEMWSQ
jgi:hypothetical protein